MKIGWSIPSHLRDHIHATLPERIDFENYDEGRKHIGIDVKDDDGVLLWILVRYGCDSNKDERMPYRHCDLHEQTVIYRYTAEHLHEQRQKEASMAALGRAVLDAAKAEGMMPSKEKQ